MQTKDKYALTKQSAKALLNIIDNLLLSFYSEFDVYDGIDDHLSTYNTAQYAYNFLCSDLPHLPGWK